MNNSLFVAAFDVLQNAIDWFTAIIRVYDCSRNSHRFLLNALLRRATVQS